MPIAGGINGVTQIDDDPLRSAERRYRRQREVEMSHKVVTSRPQTVRHFICPPEYRGAGPVSAPPWTAPASGALRE